MRTSVLKPSSVEDKHVKTRESTKGVNSDPVDDKKVQIPKATKNSSPNSVEDQNSHKKAQIPKSTKNLSPNPVKDQNSHKNVQIPISTKNSSPNPVKEKNSPILRSPVPTPPTINQISSKKKVRWQDQIIGKHQKSKRALEKLWSNPKPHEEVHLATQQCNEIEKKNRHSKHGA